MEKRVMCFGDSLTWGWNAKADGNLVGRYEKEKRWTGILANEMGPSYEVLEEGLCGRTTNVDDPLDPILNGATYLPVALASHFPLDLVVLMLGTNDTKAYFKREPFDIAVGISSLITQITQPKTGFGCREANTKVLLIAPPSLRADIPSLWVAELFDGAYKKSSKLAELYSQLATQLNFHFFNAGDVITTEGEDGIHFSEGNNKILGMEVANFISHKIFPSVMGTM